MRIHSYTVFGPKKNLILKTPYVNNALFNTNSGKITVEKNVIFGHNVSLITGNHDKTKFGKQRITSISDHRDIIVKEGAWIGSNVTILGPCTIGKDSVVGACCFVHADVPPGVVCYSNNSFIIKKLT